MKRTLFHKRYNRYDIVNTGSKQHPCYYSEVSECRKIVPVLIARCRAFVAQWLEHWSCKPGVGGSIPLGGNSFSFKQLIERYFASGLLYCSFLFHFWIVSFHFSSKIKLFHLKDGRIRIWEIGFERWNLRYNVDPFKMTPLNIASRYRTPLMDQFLKSEKRFLNLLSFWNYKNVKNFAYFEPPSYGVTEGHPVIDDNVRFIPKLGIFEISNI